MKQCIKCGKAHARKGQKYCGSCHAVYMREWRKTHKPGEDERRKSNCRAYTRVLIKRGKIEPQPCWCGIEPAQAHHPDYGNPRLVIWMCLDHHRQHHYYLNLGERAAS